MTLLKQTTVLWVVVVFCLMVFSFLRERAVCQESERCMRSQAVRDPTQQYKITRSTRNGTVQQTAPQWNETTSLHNLPDSSVNCERCRNEKQSGEQWRRVGATTMVLLRLVWNLCVFRLVWNLCVFLCEGHTKRSHILQFEQHVFSKKLKPRFLCSLNIDPYVIQPLKNTNIKIYMRSICYIPIIRYIPPLWSSVWGAWPARNGDTDGLSGIVENLLVSRRNLSNL